MSDFYDIKYFFQFIIRKIKVYIVVIILMILAVVGGRAISLVPQYLEGRNQEQATESNTDDLQGEPVYKQVTMLLRVNPQYQIIDGEEVDETQYILSAYSANMYNESIILSLRDEFFETEEKINLEKRNDLYSYGYILDKERSYAYTEYDFSRQLILEITQEGNYLKIGFYSFNQESAEAIAKRYEELLTAKVKEQVGEFQSDVKDKSVNYVLPSATAGANPSRSAANTVTMTSKTYISFGTLIKQLAKGVVWGGMLGVVVGLLFIAGWYFSTNKIQKISDIEELNANLIGSYINKSRWFRRYLVKWAHTVEGVPRVFDTKKDAVYIANEIIANRQDNQRVLLSGCGNKADIEDFASELEKECKRSVKAVEFILNSTTSMKEAKKADCVILIEKLGKSAKKEIEAEIKMFEFLNTSVLGVIISE